jgi:hypothetical protein
LDVPLRGTTVDKDKDIPDIDTATLMVSVWIAVLLLR